MDVTVDSISSFEVLFQGVDSEIGGAAAGRAVGGGDTRPRLERGEDRVDESEIGIEWSHRPGNGIFDKRWATQPVNHIFNVSHIASTGLMSSRLDAWIPAFAGMTQRERGGRSSGWRW